MGSSRRKVAEDITTRFFFTQILDEFGVKDMYYDFKEFADIAEIVIPNKNDVRGMRYGFVYFFNVQNERILATKLENIFNGKNRIFVNLPRFPRKNQDGGLWKSYKDGESNGGSLLIEDLIKGELTTLTREEISTLEGRSQEEIETTNPTLLLFITKDK